MTKKRLLFDLTIAGVTLITVYAIEKHVEKKYAEVGTPKRPLNETTEDDIDIPEKKEDVKEKVKEVSANAVKEMKKAAMKVVNFVTEHKEEVDSITSIFGLLASIFTLKGAYQKSKMPIPASAISPIVKPKTKYYDEVTGFVGEGPVLDLINDVLDNGPIRFSNDGDKERDVLCMVVKKGEAA